MHADIVYNYTEIITVSFEILQVKLGYISLFYPLPNLQRWLMSEEMCVEGVWFVHWPVTSAAAHLGLTHLPWFGGRVVA